MPKLQQDPAEGSREIVERELERLAHDETSRGRGGEGAGRRKPSGERAAEAAKKPL